MSEEAFTIMEEAIVQVVFPDGEDRVLQLADIVLQGDNPSTIGDADMIARTARWLDRPVADFNGMIVTRPRTGNILISPKPVYG